MLERTERRLSLTGGYQYGVAGLDWIVIQSLGVTVCLALPHATRPGYMALKYHQENALRGKDV